MPNSFCNNFYFLLTFIKVALYTLYILQQCKNDFNLSQARPGINIYSGDTVNRIIPANKYNGLKLNVLIPKSHVLNIK